MTRETLNCAHCGKRLSQKTARQINGVILCAPCVFGQPAKVGTRPEGQDRNGLDACTGDAVTRSGIRPALGISQADREKAQALIDLIRSEWIEEGDIELVAEAFSRHRAEALEEAARWLEGTGPDRDNGGPCRHVEHVQGTCNCDELAKAIRSHIAGRA